MLDFFRDWGFTLKLLAGLAATVFGIFGIGTKTRDDGGTLTRRGWIALIGIIVSGLLGVGTSIYEHNAGEKNARQDKIKSDRLLLSVQRGIYPLRGVRLDLEITLDVALEPILAYKETLRKAFLKNRNCSSGGDDFKCPGPFPSPVYVIPRSSRLFPSARSSVYSILRNVTVEVTMFRFLPHPRGPQDSQNPYEHLGRFEVYWMDRLPDQVRLLYENSNHLLSLQVDDVTMTGKTSGDSDIGSVYSLSDFMPGLIAAEASLSDVGVCKSFEMAEEACETQLLIPAVQNMSIESANFRFPYPKEIRMSQEEGIACRSKDRHFLVLPLHGEVDSGNLFHGDVREKKDTAEVSAVCSVSKDMTY